MKIYKIEFKNVSYEQYSEFIMVGKSKKEVLSFLLKHFPPEENKYNSEINWQDGFEIKELIPDEYYTTGIISKYLREG
jgi:hypothetical protein